MTGCRIGKIRMKQGGAEIRVFETKPRSHAEEMFSGAISECRSTTVRAAGYFIIGEDKTRTNYTRDSGYNTDAAGGIAMLMHKFMGDWQDGL
jgi:hypothetical protein